MTETGAEAIGTFVLGTVKGDLHDIGKTLVGGAPVTASFAEEIGVSG
jgi:methanogenic corrinoid protein MtbC1